MHSDKFCLKKEAVDSFTVLHQILQYANDNYPNKTAFRQPEGKTGESSVTFAEFFERTEALRAAFYVGGYKDKHFAILGETSFEWISTYLAITGGIGVAVPIDKELPAENMAMQMEFAECDTIICSLRCLRKLKKVLPLCKSIKTVIVMKCDNREKAEEIEDVQFLDDLLITGKRLLRENRSEYHPSEIDADKTCVIIFTSGTTGANKGVCLSNRNIMGSLRGCARLLHYPEVSFSVLPINHSYELHAHIMSSMYCGTTVCINDDLKNLVKNLERFKPEMSCMVPVMLDLLVKKIKKQIAESGKGNSFKKLVKLSDFSRKFGIDIRKRAFSKILSALGGNLRMIICGGAPLSQDTVDFLSSIGIDVFNGYGITECSPVVAVNPLCEIRKNSVGHILPTMNVRIASPDENGNGEIQLFGDNVMQGYYKADTDTDKVFTDDGWFKTGDIGHMDSDNFLYISGRLKNLIILPNGKNIFPEEIEEALMKKVPGIRECVVFADDKNTGIYAICYPDSELCAENGAVISDEIKKYIRAGVDKFNSEMPSYKRITDIIITDKEFEKSTTHKIQRFKIAAVNK